MTEQKGLEILRGKILGKYFTLTKLASCLGWTRQKLSDTVCGRREPTVRDIVDLSNALDIRIEELVHIFLELPSTNIDEGAYSNDPI